jgi:agmatinase
MAGTPTYALPPTFLGVTRRSADARFAILGVPFDVGTTNRPGARFGPEAIRRASRMLVDGANPLGWYDPDGRDLADLGDLPIPVGDVAAALAMIEAAAATPAHLVTLGGDHGITLAMLRALARRLGGPIGLVHFDAHIDTWPDSFGQPFGHGSVFWNAIREGLVDPRRMVQIGLRSPVQRAVWDWTVGQGVTILTAEDVHATTPAAVAARARAVVGDRPAYLSFDIDALDPAFAPGTGTPEIGGLSSWQARTVLRDLRGLDFRGMDVVEVAPAYDHAEVTALAAATLAWEYLALVDGPRKL